MKKIKELILKNLINKYRGAAVSAAVGYAVSFILAKVATGPEWLQGLVSSVVSSISDGEITELNAATLTAALTPVVAYIVNAAVNAYQSNNIEKIQQSTGEVVDGWAGPETVASVAKK
jgi:lysozyme family protein